MAQVKRNVYRKAALDRLSSPDQLDRMITIVPAGLWLALAGGAIAVVLTIAWSIIGRIPVTVQTNGVYMAGSGVGTIYSGNGGIVSDVYYSTGDFVAVGDVIAQLNNDEIQKKIDDLNARKKLVEDVTIDSRGDVGSDDNKGMLDLKSQLLTVGGNYDADQALLEAKMAELAAQNAKTDAARDAMTVARNAYYASLDQGSNSPAQLRMQDALNDVNNARQDLQNAKSDYDRYRTDVQNAKNDYNTAYSYLAQAMANLNTAKQQKDTFDATYEDQVNQIDIQKKNAEESRAVAYHEMYMSVKQYDKIMDWMGRYPTDIYYGIDYADTPDKKYEFTYDPSKEYNATFMRWENFIDPSATGYGTYIQMKNQYLQSTNQIAELDNKEQQLAEQKADYAKKVADAEKKVVDEQKKAAAAAAKYA
ncbi:MAG: hypothetical protein J5824_00235, partial [Lachnospiraceae bacterium]|nr:hypothetical protein [Lachnospiraceae bacterium]